MSSFSEQELIRAARLKVFEKKRPISATLPDEEVETVDFPLKKDQGLDQADPHEVERSQQWTCTICTCLNPETEYICEACASPAPTQVTAKNNNDTIKKIKTEWECKNCTVLNQASDNACAVCGALTVAFEEPPLNIPSVSSIVQSCSSVSSNIQSLASNCTSNSSKSQQVSVFSLNIWFEDFHDEIRMRAIAAEVKHRSPDFITFQEVNISLLSMLSPLLHVEGFKTQSSLRDRRYGEMIWWNTNTVSDVTFVQEEFVSNMGRNLHTLQATVRGQRIAGGTFHLESLQENSMFRMEQLSDSMKRLTSSKLPFFCAGDTNFGKRDDSKKITSILPSQVRDAWEVMGSDAATSGTWDTQANLNLSSGRFKTKFKASCRFDRVYFSTDKLRCDHMSLVCTDPVRASDGKTIHPSDHFGIFSIFTFV